MAEECGADQFDLKSEYLGLGGGGQRTWGIVGIKLIRQRLYS